MRWQFSLRVLLLSMAAISFGLAVWLKLSPKPGPLERPHIRVSFSKSKKGAKQIYYYVCIRDENGGLSNVTYGDVDPCDGQLDFVYCDPPGSGGKYFSNTPMFPGRPPTTPRMLAAYAKILETIKEPMKTHNVVWLDWSSPDRAEFDRINRSGEDTLFVPLPNDQATRDAFRVLDNHGKPLP